jgi:23S rRNA (guanine2445-N2)-methyltransferase / 23S rRNA (guanine2069-N7)-methyltransferase
VKTFFITCPKGLEPLLFEELTSMGLKGLKQSLAHVELQGSLEDAYRVCLWSRLANRVLMMIDRFPCLKTEQLYTKAVGIDWLSHLSPDDKIVVDFSGMSEMINHSVFGAQKIKDAIVDHVRRKTDRRPSVDKDNPDLRINARVYQDEVTISLDLSGESLHRRAYRLDMGIAPLKENLAAALLWRTQWRKLMTEPTAFVDPLCGSGTLVIEALLMAADIAPGIFRKKFGFEAWKQHDVQLWQRLLEEAEVRREQGLKRTLPIFQGYDIDPTMVDIAEQNLKHAGLENYATFTTQDLFDLKNTTGASKGLIISNPPYGARLGEEKALNELYELFARKTRQEFYGWQVGIFTGNVALCAKIGMRPVKKYKFFNGALPCELFLYEMDEKYFFTEK